MKNLGIALAVVVGLIVVAGLGMVGSYNSLVAQDTAVTAAWSQVENQLQRRNDLIPNLVETAKGYAKHEKGVFESIAQARAAMAGARSIPEKIQAAQTMDSALSRLLVVVENYPNLKADASFTRLMDELAGTENRIAVERMRYNDTVGSFNTRIRQIPAALYAQAMGFKQRDFFKAEEKAKEAPKVTV